MTKRILSEQEIRDISTKRRCKFIGQMSDKDLKTSVRIMLKDETNRGILDKCVSEEMDRRNIVISIAAGQVEFSYGTEERRKKLEDLKRKVKEQEAYLKI